MRLNTSGTLSKDRLGLVHLTVVSHPPHFHIPSEAEEFTAVAGHQVKIKTKTYQEILKDATPSEEAARLSRASRP